MRISNADLINDCSDEIAYQMARNKREQQMINRFDKQGYTDDNYPQYGTNFWGGTAENNYGFGSSNIEENAQNVTNRLNNSGWNSGLSNGQGYGNVTQPNNNTQSGVQNNTSSVWNNIKNFAQDRVNTIAPYTPTYYIGYGIGTAQNTFNKLRDLYGVYKQNGATIAAQQYGEPSVRQAMKDADWLSSVPISDVNKHQYVSCVGSTGGH